MKLEITYNRDEDIWCLLETGPSSNQSNYPTDVYQKLIDKVGENPNKVATSKFIDNYLIENKYDIENIIENYQKEWEEISKQFQKISEKVFKIVLNRELKAYLTINDRCPYRIEENLFFVTISKKSPIKIIMHELWHFYTWDKFGLQEKIVGDEKYDNIKEALTVLLNVECKKFLPEGIQDKGYPQHKELREEILKIWAEKPDIDFLWNKLTN